MCPPQLFLMALGTGVQAAGQIKQGQDQKEASDRNAKSMEIDMTMGKIEATQMHLDRNANYEEAMSSNKAMFAFQGRDIGAGSVAEHFKEQSRRVGEDIGRIDFMGESRARKMAIAASSERLAGQQASNAGMMLALGSVFTGAYRASQVYVGDYSQTRTSSFTNYGGGRTTVHAYNQRVGYNPGSGATLTRGIT